MKAVEPVTSEKDFGPITCYVVYPIVFPTKRGSRSRAARNRPVFVGEPCRLFYCRRNAILARSRHTDVVTYGSSVQDLRTPTGHRFTSPQCDSQLSGSMQQPQGKAKDATDAHDRG